MAHLCHNAPVSTIALIPSRRGGRRLSGNDLRRFAGRPIIEWSIDAARRSLCTGEVFVATDDRETARVAHRAKAKVVFMSDVEPTDGAATFAVALVDFLYRFSLTNFEPAFLCCLCPTAPFVTPERIREGWELISSKGGATSVFSVDPSRPSDLAAVHRDARVLYWLSADALRTEGRLFTKLAWPLELGPQEAQDLDAESDWTDAERRFERLVHPARLKAMQRKSASEARQAGKSKSRATG